MAPDVDSLGPPMRHDRSRAAPPSQPPSASASRRTSQIMGPPLVPASAASIPSPRRRSMSTHSSSHEHGGMPMRHPRPLTAAELYLECEKEQEAVVNRLTRELTALRAQSASVASNASHSSASTSASLLPVDIADPNPTHQMAGATHPAPSRRHRSSSSLSARSIPTPSTGASAAGSGITNPSAQGPVGSAAIVPIGGVSQASADRAAAASAAATAAGGNLSRQPSVSASGRSTPARRSLETGYHGHSPGPLYTLPHRTSLPRDPSYASTQNSSSTAAQAGTPLPHPSSSQAQSPSQSVLAAMQHYADATAFRSEMDAVKAENEALKQRVRALERALRARRRDSSLSDAARPVGSDSRVAGSRDSSDSRPIITNPAAVAAWAAHDGGVGGVAGPRERSESQSTSASSRPGPAMDDDVRVGESAGSVGLGRGL